MRAELADVIRDLLLWAAGETGDTDTTDTGTDRTDVGRTDEEAA
jgi:hypothetical protein